MTAQARDRRQVGAERFIAPLTGLFLPGYPGLYVNPLRVANPVVEYWPTLVPTEALHHEVVLADGSRLPVKDTPVRAEFRGQPPSVPASPGSSATTRRAPLGLAVHGRCGDKGGNSNVGFWPRGTSDAAWAWLRAAITAEWVAEVYPGAAIERHEFPGLRAVHLVIHGVLGKGASSNGRPDIAGKAVAEFLRARHVEIPEEVLS